MTITESIKSEARRLGFQKVGIAGAEELAGESGRLAEWLDRGYHGTMDWMEKNREKRVDPEKVLPGVKSVLVAGMNYYTDIPHSSANGAGKISRYAWGDDYHTVLGERLRKLLDYSLALVPGSGGRTYVDTGPVMEKAWAQRAGIGWQGKHTNIITGDLGSWIFLGVMLLDIELETDRPATDHCGSCTLCIEACPTEAIVRPYVLDSNRCISYLTIEHRGEIAAELGEKFDRWIYGCDICQDVCPWNEKFSRGSGEAGFAPREHAVAPDLETVAGMSPAEFNVQYRKSPIKRTKHAGMVRNALVALNSQKGPAQSTPEE